MSDILLGPLPPPISEYKVTRFVKIKYHMRYMLTYNQTMVSDVHVARTCTVLRDIHTMYVQVR